MDEKNEMIDIKEVCEIFGKDKTTIYKWMKSKGMPSAKVGGTRVFNRRDLMDWAYGASKKYDIDYTISEMIRMAEHLKKLYRLEREYENNQFKV